MATRELRVYPAEDGYHWKIGRQLGHSFVVEQRSPRTYRTPDGARQAGDKALRKLEKK